MIERLEKLTARYNELNELLSDPDIFNNKDNYLKITKEQKELDVTVKVFNEFKHILNQIDGNKELIAEESDKELIA